ncbi:hypothetical protein OJAV_G00187080 [Oryzias javanicus]|uniref:Ig-like domain-containing protein n=1 Tax=Oryzias javanicus TaxID=123683 RepID=A0A3S2M3G6_ORYJA|nr:hypothetical protein OJAV_G00187080 [Oryzias javanicus]
MSSIFFRTLALMSVLLCGVSADAAISLHCNQPVNVTFGQVLNLTCVIELKQDDCKDVYVEWNDTVEDLCVNNRCTFVNKTNATLQMLKVTENKTITVTVGAVCGKASKTVIVKVYPDVHLDGTAKTPAAIWQITTSEQPEKNKRNYIAAAAVSVVVIGVVVVVGAVVYMKFKRKCPPLSSTAESDALTDAV